MSRKPLKKEVIDEFKERIGDLELLRDFYEKSRMDDISFTSIQRFDEISITDGVNIPEPLVAERKDGNYDIFNEYIVEEIEPDVLGKIEVRGMNKEDALALVKDGMTCEQILQAAETLPGMESDQMLLMIQSQYEPDLLANLEKQGITIEELEDGKIQVKALAKIAEVDSEGKTKLSPKLEEQLEVFEQMGLVSLSDDLVVEMIEPKQKELSKEEALQANKEDEELEEQQPQKTKLKIVPIKEKEKAKTQNEIEKAKMAKELDVEPEDIMSVIRFADREVASQYFNETVDMDHSAVLVRLKNNKFWMMLEDGEGKLAKQQGMEVSPASKLLADKLQDTHHKGDTWVLPGDMVAGKTNPNSERYDFFEVMLPGESRTDGASSAMYVGLSDNNVQDMRIITSRNNNVYELDEAHTRSIVPSKVYINSNRGERAEMDLDTSKEHELSEKKEKGTESQSASLEDLAKQQELLERLLEIEKEIQNTENDGPAEPPSKDKDKTDPDISDDLADETRKLPDLYQQRSEILTELGVKETDSVDQEQEITEDLLHEHRLGGNH